MLYRRLGKRCFDLALSGVALLILAPILVAIALVVRLRLGTPVFFRQQRPGQYGQPFTLIKFRTMTNARDAEDHLLPDAQRLPPLGRFLRSTSLDELPELWNVLTGDMSLVGPRPLLMRYLERYTPEQARRHDVRPGITGWAQINGRNTLSWTEKFDLDIWYIDNLSLSLDLKIIMLTAVRIIQRSGINASDHVTMPEFTGASIQDDNI